jgi:aldose 1-epimerase
MPAGLGLHPYFSLTDRAFVTCSVNKMWAVDEENMPTELVDSAKDLDDSKGLLVKGSHLDNVFTGYAGHTTLYWPEWRAKARISSSKTCQFVVLFSPKDKNFFCVEPVTHCTDAINMANNGVANTGIKYLKPRQKMTISMRISPEEMAMNRSI